MHDTMLSSCEKHNSKTGTFIYEKIGFSFAMSQLGGLPNCYSPASEQFNSIQKA